MNLLNVAMGAIGRINPNVKVNLIRRESVLNEGISEVTETLTEAVAQVQPAGSNDIIPGDTFLNSAEARRFYINGDRAEVVSFFENASLTSSIIEFNGKRYGIYSKVNWSANGWIKVIGVLNDDLPSDI